MKKKKKKRRKKGKKIELLIENTSKYFISSSQSLRTCLNDTIKSNPAEKSSIWRPSKDGVMPLLAALLAKV